jgi:hypothetical protein
MKRIVKGRTTSLHATKRLKAQNSMRFSHEPVWNLISESQAHEEKHFVHRISRLLGIKINPSRDHANAENLICVSRDFD